MTGSIEAFGNIQSLINYNLNIPNDFCYFNLFSGCTRLTTPPQLPATTLADFCYMGMFRLCYNLSSAPKLPATTLAYGCYGWMFDHSNLSSAPDLPATTLAPYCYEGMFYFCFKLSSINVAFTTWTPTNATNYWVDHVSNTGTFTKPTALVTTRGINNIPSGWTVKNM